jgi:NTE family protein
MTAQFRNLVFEGGGVKGIAYVGAIQVLAQRGALTGIRRVGGTSAGAINALILTLGYDLGEQKTILESTDFSRFMDDSFGVIRDIRRLATKFGWYKGDFFSGWIGDQHLHSDDWQRTVYIDTLDVKTTDFHITRDRQQAIVEQGIKGAQKYFEWFDDPRETPVNRISEGS